jgi:hypothetical protein
MLDYRASWIVHVEQGDQAVDSELYRDSINAQLSGVLASNSTQGTFTTGTFAFTEPEIRKIITNWLDLAGSYDDSINKAIYVKTIEGPGLDFASQSFAATANRSGESLLEYLLRNRDYCVEQAQLSQNALDDYLGVEHTNVTGFNKMDQQGPKPGI